MITKSKQQWEVGQTVKVGFLSGLIVLAKVPTPGDCAPDAYLLARGEKFYSFVPHNGLTGIDFNEARQMARDALTQKQAFDAALSNHAAKTIQAAGNRAELLAMSA
jgi:hypothetical protein